MDPPRSPRDDRSCETRARSRPASPAVRARDRSVRARAADRANAAAQLGAELGEALDAGDANELAQAAAFEVERADRVLKAASRALAGARFPRCAAGQHSADQEHRRLAIELGE